MLFEKGGCDFHRLAAPWLTHPERMRGIFQRVHGGLNPQSFELCHHLSATDFERILLTFDEDKEIIVVVTVDISLTG